jgi:chemotaxis protein CheD
VNALVGGALSAPQGPPTREVYLHPGQLVASSEPRSITTILGSCVAACIWDPYAGIGGMNHFLLPHFAGPSSASPRFGSVAMAQLVEELVGLGARADRLRAKVFGGGCVVEALRRQTNGLGAQNVDVALRFLRELAIPVMSEDVGGDRGRKLCFKTADGASQVRLFGEGGDERR